MRRLCTDGEPLGFPSCRNKQHASMARGGEDAGGMAGGEISLCSGPAHSLSAIDTGSIPPHAGHQEPAMGQPTRTEPGRRQNRHGGCASCISSLEFTHGVSVRRPIHEFPASGFSCGLRVFIARHSREQLVGHCHYISRQAV
jgi:hypothetical protein